MYNKNDQIRKILRSIAGKSINTNNLQFREIWLQEELQKIRTGSRILDAGAGEEQYKKFCQHLNYVSQDLGEYDGDGNRSGLQMGKWDGSKLDIVSDITDIPEPDLSFDAIMCIEVLEHLASPIQAIKEFSRLLRPGGKLILTAPFSSLTHFAPSYYYTGYSKYFYEKWLNECDLDIVSLTNNGNFFEFLCQELGRLRYISRKYTKGTRVLNLLEYCALYILLKSLKRLSKHDIGSEEVLCFGLQITAVKREVN